MRDQIEHLKKIHYDSRAFLDNQDYDGFRQFVRKHFDNPEVNELHMILVVMQSLKDKLPDIWNELNDKYNKALGVAKLRHQYIESFMDGDAKQTAAYHFDEIIKLLKNNPT